MTSLAEKGDSVPTTLLNAFSRGKEVTAVREVLLCPNEVMLNCPHRTQ